MTYGGFAILIFDRHVRALVETAIYSGTVKLCMLKLGKRAAFSGAP